MRVIAAALAAVLLCACTTEPQTSAPPTCAEHRDVMAVLTQQYGERTIVMGITDKDELVEITTAPGGSTWTLLTTTPDGHTTCLTMAGQSLLIRQPRQ